MKRAETKDIFQFVRITIVLAIILTLTYSILNKLNVLKEEIVCDAESVASTKEHTAFSYKNYEFSGSELRTQEGAHSGTFSVKLTSQTPYGMTIEFKDLKAGDELEVSVWCKFLTFNKSGFPSLVATVGKEFYQGTGPEQVPKDNCGWFEIKQTIVAPGSEPLKIYCWNSGGEILLVDDLKIKRANLKSFLLGT